jgi:hypothetical protein
VPGRESDHSSSSNTEVNNAQSCSPKTPIPFVGLVLIQAFGPLPEFALPLVSPILLRQVLEIHSVSITYSSLFPLSSPATVRQAGCNYTSVDRVSLNHA